MGWSPTLQYPDYGGAMDNDLIAIKPPNIGHTAHQILADIGRSSGKYYFEVRMRGNGITPANCAVGVRHEQGQYDGGDYVGIVGSTDAGWGYLSQGRFYRDGSLRTSDPAAWGTQNTWYTIGVAIDFTLGYAWFSRDGVWQARSGRPDPDPTTGTDPSLQYVTGEVYPAADIYYDSRNYLFEAVLQSTTENIEHMPSGYSAWDLAEA